MTQIPPIEDAYIDSIIKSAGAYQPSLNKTQGIKLRELMKLLRDRFEQEIGSSTLTGLNDVTITGPITGQTLIFDGTIWANQSLGSAAYLNAFEPAEPNTIVQRNSSGDIISRLFKMNIGIGDNPVFKFLTMRGDGYIVNSSTAQMQSGLGIQVGGETLQSVRDRSMSIYSTDNSSTSYSTAAFQIRETSQGGGSSFLPPRMALHWSGVVASQIGLEANGRIAILNNPGTAYEGLNVGAIQSDAGILVSAGYDVGYQLEDGFSIVRRAGYTGFNYGHTEKMAITSTGIVVQGEGYFSNGVLQVNNTDTAIPALGAAGGSLRMTSHGVYGLYAGIQGSGEAFMQVQRNDGDTAVYNLKLQPNGGNINIGEIGNGNEKLNVGGWINTVGNVGWFNSTYQGGLHMTDPTWVRVYNTKAFLVDNQVRANGFVNAEAGFGFKSANFRGMVGNYDNQGTSEMLIWTIGDQWNEISTHYGIGYQYYSKYTTGHQIVFKNAGITHASINLENGNAHFDGTVYAASGFGIDGYNTVSAPVDSPMTYFGYHGHSFKTLNNSQIAQIGDGSNSLDSVFNGRMTAPIIKVNNQLIIPTSRPANPERGSIWIE